MADQWFFAWDKQRFGPFSAVQLKALAVLGRLQPKDVVWKNDIEQGVIADKVKHLFPGHQATSLPLQQGAAVADALSSSQLPPEGFASSIPNESAEAAAVAAATIIAPDTESIEEQAPETSPALTDAADETAPSPANPKPRQADAQKKPAGKGRATAMKGAVIVSQDGEFVKYRKKCTHCSCEDACTRGIPIRVGITRETFFCPKCRKKREVVIQGKR